MKKTYTIQTNDFKISVGKGVIEIPTIDVTGEQIRKLIKENPELLTPTPTHKRKYFVPKVGEEFWYIDNNQGKPCRDKYQDSYFCRFLLSTGNCFATEQDAQDELNRRQAIVRIWNNYDDKYSWDIDWKNIEQTKYYIVYNHSDEILDTDMYHIYQSHTELPYFKSAKDRNQFVESNKEDLLKIFNIKTK